MVDFGNKSGPSFSLPFFRDEPHACPYLPDRMAEHVIAPAGRLSPAIYQQLMDLGFRRSGRIVYRPECTGCRECVPLRVPVNSFQPSRSQRRAWRRNQDVCVEIGTPVATEEKWQVYTDYLAIQHNKTADSDRSDFERFLYDSPIETIEFVYSIEGKVVAAGICDVCPLSLSSVYFYFDPASAQRSLGVYSALVEIEECRRRGLPYWYAGYYVRDCRTMNYKSTYRPNELLGTDGIWRANTVVEL